MAKATDAPSLFDQLSHSYGQQQLADRFGVTERTVRRWKQGEVTPPKRVHRQAASTLVRDAPGENFTFIDLFAGIGGTRLGFEGAGGRCVFTSEWDRFSQRTYLENFGIDEEGEFAGDVTQVAAEDVPDHDVLVAGFPCQPFSIAGVSKKNSLGRPHGFEDMTQGTLFFDVARIIAAKQPKAFLLENVKNLHTHDKGKTFATIMHVLTEELGYRVSHRIVDASPWVPQGRKRIFIVGFREENDFDFGRLAVPEDSPTMGGILHPEDGTEQAEGHFTEGDLAAVNPKYVLSAHLWQYLQDYKRKHQSAGNGFGFGLVGPDDVARTLSARYHKDGSEILVDRGRDLRPRRLTPRECARLMGFPDSYRIPVSDTQAYRQFGNSVVVPVVESIAELMATEL